MSLVQDILSQQISSRDRLANFKRMTEQLPLFIDKTSKQTACENFGSFSDDEGDTKTQQETVEIHHRDLFVL